MSTNLDDIGLMSFPEASLRWGMEKTYVRQQFVKYPNKFLKGSTAKVGSGNKPCYVITRQGMEHLMKMTEKQANEGMWLVRRQENWITNYEQRVNSELAARKLISKKIGCELNDNAVKVEFEKYQTSPVKARTTIKGNVIYSYEKCKR